MSSDLFFEGKKFISSRRAADLCAYTQDYVGQLIRSGKLEAKMVGRNWFVAEESILAYKRLADESSKTLFQKTDEAISASRDASEHEAVEAVEVPVAAKAPDPVIPEVVSPVPAVREEAYVGLVYTYDERSSLPELKKTSVQPVAKAVVEPAVPETVEEVVPEPVAGVVSPFIYEESIEGLGGDFGMIDIGRKALAAALSLSLVLGSYYMADAERSRSFLSSTEAVGSRMSLAVTDTFAKLAASVGVVKEAYLAAVHNAGVYAVEGVVAFVGAAEDVVSLYGDAVETVGRRSSDASDVLASVSIPDTARTIAAQIRVEGIGSASLAAASTAGGSLVSGLESVAVGVYEAINPIFSRTSSFLAGLFAPKDTVLVIDTPAPIAPQPEPQREAVAVVASPVVVTQPAQPVTQVNNTYYQTSGLSAADVTALVKSATADLEAQVAQAQLDALRANENARNAADRGSRYDLDRITIRRSEIKDSRMTGSTIADSRIENSTLVNANLTGTTTAGLIAADSITANSITFSNSNIQNSTTTNATSTNLFASAFAADRLQVAGSTGVTITSSGLVGIGTSTPEAQLAIAQITNGLPMLSARRVTDVAPSGDFINYRSADGGTVLFRVDNSGNLLAGGIITTGSYTVTSTSTPQFRVQYDGSAEMTTMVASTGAAVIAVNGSNPSVSFVPQSNGTSTFAVTDASLAPIVSVNTIDKSATVTNLIASTGVVAGLSSTYSTSTNATSTNFFSANFVAVNSLSDNATTTNLSAATVSAGDIVATGSLAVTGQTTLGGVVLVNSTTTNAVGTNLAFVNSTSTNLYAQSLASDDSVLGNATSTNFFSTFGRLLTGTIDSLSSTIASIGDLFANTLVVTNSTTTNATTTNLYAQSLVAGTSTFAALNASGQVVVGTTTGSSYIGWGGYGYDAALTVEGGAKIVSNTGETLIQNTTNYPVHDDTTLFRNNVLAIQNTGVTATNRKLPSAIRFLDETGAEMGAIGYSNDNVWAPFAESFFISASQPYYPGTPAQAPTRFALLQEGLYQSVARYAPRLEFTTDWTTNFKDPLGNTNLSISPSGTSTFRYSLTSQVSSSTVLTVHNTGGSFNTSSAPLSSYAGSFTSASTRSAGSNALTNVGIYASASGAQNNYAAIFDQGNVGIGTSTPNRALSVVGDIDFTGSLRTGGVARINSGGVFIAANGTVGNPGYNFSGDTGSDTGMYRVAEDTIGFSTAGVNRLTIGNTGNIGVGTTSPTARVSTVFSSNSTSNAINLSPSNDGNRALWLDGNMINVSTVVSSYSQTANSLPLFIQPYWSNFQTGLTVGTTTNQTAVNTAMIVYGSNASSATTSRTFATRNGDNTETFTVLNSGNIGIGTTSPSTRLTVHETGSLAAARLLNASNAFDTLQLQSTISNGYSSIGFLNTSGNSMGGFGYANTGVAGSLQDKVYFYSVSKDMVFSTNNGSTGMLTLNTAGNLGIGSTTPLSTLSVTGSGTTRPFTVASSTGNALFSVGIDGSSTSTGTSTAASFVSTSVIATSSIMGSLHVGGLSNTTARLYSSGAIQFINGTDPGLYGALWSPNSGDFAANMAGPQLAFYTGGNNARIERLRIDSAGNVGIGTTSPTQLLTLYKSGGDAYTQYASSNTGSAATDGFHVGVGTAGEAFLNNRESTSMLFRTAGVSRMVIDSGGNVGIGTTTPLTKLDIVSNISDRIRMTGSSSDTNPVNGSWGGAMYLSNSDTTSGNYNGVLFANATPAWTSGIFGINTTHANRTGELSFFTWNAGVGSEKMRITPAGNVGIGTTSPASLLAVSGKGTFGTSDAVTPQLEVIGGTSGAGMIRLNRAGTGTVFDWALTGGGLAFNDVSGASGATVVNIFGASGLNELYVGQASKTIVDTRASLISGTTFGSSAGTDVAAQNLTLRSGLGTGAGVPGDLVFQTGTVLASGSTAQSGSARLTIKATTGNVGIGTTTPQKLLHLYGDPTTARLRMQSNTALNSVYAEMATDASTGSFNLLADHSAGAANSSIGFFVDGSQRVIIDQSGNVGIGTTTPGVKLEVAGDVRIPTGSVGTASLRFGVDNNSGFYQPSSGSIAWTSGSVERFRITNTGEVGIGTTSPTARLQVDVVDSDASSYTGDFAVVGSTNKAVALGVNSTYGWMQSHGSVPLAINPNGNNVGIGSTSPAHLLSVSGSSGGWMGFNSAGTGGGGSPTLSLSVSPASNASAGAYQTLRGNLEAWVDVIAQNNASGQRHMRFGNGQPTNTFSVQALNDAGNTILRTPFSVHNLAPTASLYVSSTGNVGVGTSSPAAPLTVFSTVANNAAGQEVLRLGAPLSGGIPGSGPAIVFANNAGTVENFKIRSGADASGSGRGNLTFSGGGATLATLSDLMTLSYTGNLGIGTTSPAAKLSVVGETLSSWFTATSTTATSSIAGSFDVGNGALRYNYGTGLTSIDNLQLGNLNFEADSGVVTWVDMPVTAASAAGTKQSYTASINGNPLLTVYSESDGAGGIQNSGVGIGTSTPLAKLDIWGNFRVSTSTSAASPLVFANTASGMFGIGTSSPTAQLHTTGTVRFSNFGSGTLTTDASGNVSVSSDERLKDISGRFSRGLEDLKKISPILYKWNATSGLDMVELYAGFSAQNVETAIPEAVGVNPNGFLSLNDRPILAASVNAIKELALSVASTTERVAGIESRVRSLELTLATAGVPGFVTATTSASSTIETVTGWLASLGASIENAVARFVTVIADAISTKKLTVGDTSNLAASGITIFDRSTGQPVCMFVEGGVMKSEPGECGAQSQPSTPEPSQQDPQPTQPEPAPSEPSGETASTTPEVTGSTGTTTPEIAPEPTASTTPEVTPEAQPEVPQETTGPEEVVASETEPEQAPEAPETPSEPASEPEPTPVATE